VRDVFRGSFPALDVNPSLDRRDDFPLIASNVGFARINARRYPVKPIRIERYLHEFQNAMQDGMGAGN